MGLGLGVDLELVGLGLWALGLVAHEHAGLLMTCLPRFLFFALGF